MPRDFIKIVNYVKGLAFGVLPNYQYIKQILNKIAGENYIIMDGKFDIEMSNHKEKDHNKPTITIQKIIDPLSH